MSPQPIDPRDPNRAESQRRTETSESQGSEASKPDTVNISPDARETDALQTKLTDEIRNTSDVHEDKVADVKARIASGEFNPNSDETKRAVADALLNQMGV
jgi:flagellar biosynthesis anti-sigma factor FlgM